MLHFLSSLFSPSIPDHGGPDQAVIDAAIERTVNVTDRRLRALGDYRKRLKPAVECSVRHVIAMVDNFPAPAEISHSAFGEDPRLRAFFVSNEHLSEALGRFRDLRDFLDHSGGTVPDRIFGLLSMAMEERSILGMELEGNVIRKDVLQTSTTFMGHRFICPAVNEADARWELKKRAFDFLLQTALERLVEEKARRIDLDFQYHLLRQKLDTMKTGGFGLHPIFSEQAEVQADIASLEDEIETIEIALRKGGTPALALDESLGLIADTLQRPSHWLSDHEIRLCLDYRGIKVTGRMTSSSPPEIKLTEMVSELGKQRVVFFGWVPIGEIPKRKLSLNKVSL